MRDKFKNLFYSVLGIIIFLFFLTIPIIIIQGTAIIGEKILPWLSLFSVIVFFILLMILLPLSFFKITRSISGIGIHISSYVFGLTLWFMSLLITYYIWGIIPVIIGLFIMGVGVVPIAMLASIINGYWDILIELIVLLCITFGSRIYSGYLIDKSEHEAYRENVAIGE